jgi:hypothetical protein
MRVCDLCDERTEGTRYRITMAKQEISGRIEADGPQYPQFVIDLCPAHVGKTREMLRTFLKLGDQECVAILSKS